MASFVESGTPFEIASGERLQVGLVAARRGGESASGPWRSSGVCTTGWTSSAIARGHSSGRRTCWSRWASSRATSASSAGWNVRCEGRLKKSTCPLRLGKAAAPAQDGTLRAESGAGRRARRAVRDSHGARRVGARDACHPAGRAARIRLLPRRARGQHHPAGAARGQASIGSISARLFAAEARPPTGRWFSTMPPSDSGGESLRQLLQDRTSAAVEKAVRSGGEIAEDEVAALGRLARLVELPQGRRGPAAAAAVATRRAGREHAPHRERPAFRARPGDGSRARDWARPK